MPNAITIIGLMKRIQPTSKNLLWHRYTAETSWVPHRSPTDRATSRACCRPRSPSNRRVVSPRCQISVDPASRGGVSYEVPLSEEHTSELQSRGQLVCRLLLQKKRIIIHRIRNKF